MNTPLASGHLYGRTYIVHRVVVEGVGEHPSAYLEWSYDGEGEVRHARNWAPGEDGHVWDRASRAPQVAAAIADAKQEWKAAGGVERARREMAARLDRARRLRAEAERTGRPCHIRFGSLPQSGRSWNHRDNQAEAGVSVYAAWQLDGSRYVVDLRDVDAISAAFIIDEDAPVYEVTGTLLDETGTDGEPLIANAAARQVRPTSIETVV